MRIYEDNKELFITSFRYLTFLMISLFRRKRHVKDIIHVYHVLINIHKVIKIKINIIFLIFF